MSKDFLCLDDISGRMSLLILSSIRFRLEAYLICLFLFETSFYLLAIFCCKSTVICWASILTSLSSKVMYFMKLLETAMVYWLIQFASTISKLSSCSFPTWLSTAFSPLLRLAEMVTCPSSNKYAFFVYLPYSERASRIIFFSTLACFTYFLIISASSSTSLQ